MKRQLSDEDIQAIVTAFRETDHVCRFSSDITPEDMYEAVRFYRHFNQIMSDTGSTLRKTIVVLGVGGLVTIIGLGLISKARQVLGI